MQNIKPVIVMTGFMVVMVLQEKILCMNSQHPVINSSNLIVQTDIIIAIMQLLKSEQLTSYLF